MRDAGARSRLHRALGAAAALGTVALTTPAHAAPLADPVDLGLEASIVSAPTPYVEPGDPLSAMVTVSNTTGAPVDDATVAMRVTRDPLEDREALAEFLGGGEAALVTVGTAPLGVTTTTAPASGSDGTEEVTRLGDGVSTTVSVTAREGRLPFAEDSWAAHGVTLELRVGDQVTTLLTGAVTWADADVPELTLSTLATASGLSARVRAVATASSIDGVTLAIDGTALSALGTSTFDLSDRDVMRLPAQDPDLVSLAHAENTSLLDYSLARSEQAATGGFTDLPWLGIVGEADRPTLRLAADAGATALLVTDGLDAATSGVTAATLPSRGDGARLTLLTPDATLSGYAVADGEVDPGAVGAAVAAGALTAAETDAPVLVWTGDDWTPSASDATDALAGLLESPFVSTVGVAELVEADEGRTTRAPALVGEDDDLGQTAITGLTTRLADLMDLSVVADDPDDVLDPGGAAVLSPLTRSLRGDEVARELRLADSATSIDATLGALHVAAGSDINFIADKGALPVTVVNDLDVDATVVVDMTSFSANLQIRDSPTVTVPARSSITVPVEVSAVSTANVQARTVLRNTDGASIAAPVSMSVRVRADWGTAVTAVFTVGLIVMLVLGVIRTVRRGRKDTRTARTDGGGKG